MTVAEAEKVSREALNAPSAALYKEKATALDFLLAELARKDEALRTIAEHEVVLEDDPCDWHCTEQLTTIARAALGEQP